MSSTTDIIFQAAEAISAISLPVGGGLAAYAKWRRNAERDRRAREEAARIASEKATKDARQEEQATRQILIAEYQDRVTKLNEKYDGLRAENAELREEIERLHGFIVQILSGQKIPETPEQPHE